MPIICKTYWLRSVFQKIADLTVIQYLQRESSEKGTYFNKRML